MPTAEPRVRLVHWHAAEAAERGRLLRKAGYRPETGPITSQTLRELSAKPPAAVVIDLARQPSQGRDVGVAIRHRKATRHIPLVFVGGDKRNSASVRQHLPDATFASWRGIKGALRRAIAHPPATPAVPAGVMAGYSGTPLVKKLGIKPQTRVALVDAPKDFEQTLGTLPPGVTIQSGNRGRRDLTIWFVSSRSVLRRRVSAMVRHGDGGGLWIAWPKQASGIKTDVTQHEVRRSGLDAGLVDYKICAIDETWSGLKFSKRRSS